MSKDLTQELKVIKDVNLYSYLQKWLKKEGKIYSETTLEIIIELFKSAAYIDQETFKLNRDNNEEIEKCRSHSEIIQSKLNYFLVEFLYYLAPIEIIPEISLKWRYDDEDFWYKSSTVGDVKALHKIKRLMNNIYNQWHCSESVLTLIAPFIIRIILLKHNTIRNCDNFSSYDKEFFKIVFGKKIEDYRFNSLEESFPVIFERYLKAPFNIMKFLNLLNYRYLHNKIKKKYSNLESLDYSKLKAIEIYKYYLVIFLRNKTPKFSKQIIIATYILLIAYSKFRQFKSFSLYNLNERVISTIYNVYEKIDESVPYSSYNDMLCTFYPAAIYEYGFIDNVFCKIAFRELSLEHQEILIQGIKGLSEYFHDRDYKSPSHIINILSQDFLSIPS